MANGRSLWVNSDSYYDSPIFGDDIKVVHTWEGGPVDSIEFKVTNAGVEYEVTLKGAAQPGWLQGRWDRGTSQGPCQARIFTGNTGISLQGTWKESHTTYDWIVYIPQ